VLQVTSREAVLAVVVVVIDRRDQRRVSSMTTTTSIENGIGIPALLHEATHEDQALASS